jgi:hypothetical protein
MATNATYNPSATTTRPADKPTGPFGEQGQRPGPAPREGEVAKNIERVTSQWPSDTFLWAALGAVGASMMLRTANQKQASLFVGQWVSPLLLFGVYNKLVKLGGSDKFSR